ncbi:regulatory protein RecX [Arenibaculum pallidiluteum]|uniref:regulatory protein RecX n=1 Tax=Arenibaculum pallidiluteum TaxID=2812559 RepID=UPI001A97A4CD|nr:RecX family transcriptional regulator [Arenibaculum pallidiluteum]
MDGAEQRGRKVARRVTPQSLENAALHYLERFATSSANLRRVLMRRVQRSARDHGTDPEEGAAWVDALVERYRRSGILDDRVYAEARAASLQRRGASTRAIREKLAAKGIGREQADAALDALGEEIGGDLDLEAAKAFARRRRLGPFRAGDREAQRERDLAALGRAGFSYETARRVIDARDPDAIDEE